MRLVLVILKGVLLFTPGGLVVTKASAGDNATNIYPHIIVMYGIRRQIRVRLNAIPSRIAWLCGVPFLGRSGTLARVLPVFTITAADHGGNMG